MSKLLYVTGVLEEAEFYNVAELVALVKQHIADRDAKRNQVSTCVVKLHVFSLHVKAEICHKQKCLEHLQYCREIVMKVSALDSKASCNRAYNFLVC